MSGFDAIRASKKSETIFFLQKWRLSTGKNVDMLTLSATMLRTVLGVFRHVLLSFF